jgi:type II secretory pathway component PulF
MSTFHYTARNREGEPTSGTLEARSTVDAVNQLHRLGYRIERLATGEAAAAAEEVVPPPGVSGGIFDQAAESGSAVEEAVQTDEVGIAEEEPLPDLKLGVEDLAEIAGRIAGITRSQLPLTPGLRALSEELPSRSLRNALRTLCDRLERGETLEEALKSHGTEIPGYIGGLILIGVRSGRLGEVMEWFRNHVRRQVDLRRRCRASLLYPVILFLAGLSAATFGLVWIIPDVERMLKDFDAELPTLTAAVVTASEFVRHYGIFVALGLAAVVVGVPVLLNGLGGRVLRHRALASTPFVGTMFRCSALAGFCELLAMFVAGHLPLPEAVRLAGEGSGDGDLDQQFQGVAECLEHGEEDPALVRRLANISPNLIHVFHWKTRQATFVDALHAAARIYENQAQMQITIGGLFLEPIVIVGVLGGVGLFAGSIFAPIIKLLHELT